MGRLIVLFALLFWPGAAWAHVVLPENHDRIIAVTLAGHARPGHALLRVDYRLEVDEGTAILVDLAAVKDKLDLSEYRDRRRQLFQEFARCYGPILGRNLDARIDGRPIELACIRHGYRLKDEQGNTLGHLRCDFVFEAAVALRKNATHRLVFREGNYEQASGKVTLSFASRKPIEVLDVKAPTPALQEKHPTTLSGKEETQLRTVAARFLLPEAAGSGANNREQAAGEKTTTQEQAGGQEIDDSRDADGGDHLSLRDLFLHSDHGIVLLLLLAFGIGAVHALTPGHGKTLVAAYLVGERGTVWHAVLLGVVTTLTHTGIVFVLAVALNWMSQGAQRAVLQALPLVGGLIVVAVGFWLLLRRLAGQADHVHFGAHAHHHHHEPGDHHHHHAHADHYHDEQGQAHPLASEKRRVGWWGLVLLGVSGGIVPCVDAVIMLVVAAAMNLLWLAVPMLLAFSAGLAGVLVLVGILVVKAKRIAEGRWGDSRLFRALPVLSAVVVMGMGGWLCYDGVYGQGAKPAEAAKTSAK